MTAKPAPVLHPHALAVMVLTAGLIAAWFAYAPGLSASLQFDDHENLGGLAAVRDFESAFRFVATGLSGPLGRPLSLASFVPQAYAWPSAPEVLLRTNILIHLLNGVLVVWFLYLLGRARRTTERQAALVAAAAGTIWMLMPLLASSSLFIVQRMTTLSALFTLLGGVGYLYARQASAALPTMALFGMTLAIGLGAVLAALTKENGILLFLFILAGEFALLERPPAISQRLWRGWFTIVLIAPTIALGIYVSSLLPYSENVVLMRDFTSLERLITQAEILWKYLHLAFLPDIPRLGPFHDDYPIQRSLRDSGTIFSIGAWFAAIVSAVIFRRKAPLFTFAVAWYLFGHILESTTINLELYFEHRNYLPLIGPIYAVAASLAQLEPSAWRRLVSIGAIAYTALLVSLLFRTTSLWGSPALAAEMWHIYKPSSLRAAQHLAGILERQGDPYSSRRVLNRYIDANPDAHGVRLQVLVISCQLEPDEDHREAIRLLKTSLPGTRFNYSVVTAFQQLYEVVSDDRCPSIDRESLYELGEGLLDNPKFNTPVIRHNIHGVMARIGIDQRDFARTMSHMESALGNYHNPDTLMLAIGILNSGGRKDISRQLLEDARNRAPPRHPLRALQWKQQLDRIEEALSPPEHSRNPGQ